MCIKIGISKKEFLEDYYPKEINEIIKEYAELNKTSEEQEVSADSF